MKPIIPLAAGAAVVVLAVVLGSQFLAGSSSVGGPTSSPSPTPTSAFVGGQFVFAGDNPINIDASSDGSSLSGTVDGEWGGEPFRIRLDCLRQYDPATWMLAGVLTQSAVPDNAVGSWAAVIVRDGSPQQAGIYTQPKATAAGCAVFVSQIPDSAVDGQEMIAPMNEGNVTLPVDSGG